LRSPHDAEALRGRAASLQALGRRTDAAETLDVLSEALEVTGRLADACEATRRALELAEQKARRRRFQELTRRLRLRAGEPAAERPGSPAAPGGEAATQTIAARAEGSVAGPDALSDDARAPGGGVGPAGTIPGQPEAATPGWPEEQALAGTEPPGAQASAESESPVVPQPADPVVLVMGAQAALDAGDHDAARAGYLAAAARFEADGLLAAALDACYDVLAFAPDDPDVHLRLVELYLALDWTAAAADKLALLGRLAELDNRPGRVRAQIVGLAADHFPDDARLSRLSATGTGPG
jgi:tetratricopeptide (TPR) repeat protein